ncbi:MAG: AsmA-like C-terminal region-containing protein, partial [Bacteroidota bacterium]
LEHEGSGDFTQDLFTLSTFTKSQQAFVTYEKIPYVAGAVAEIKADLDMDMKGMKFTFKKNEAKLNDFMISVDGFVAMPDTNIDMELKFATPKTDFKTFLSMIPAIYSNDFKGLTASGTVGLDALLKGRYNSESMPGFSLQLKIENGRFQYPSLPSSVKDVFVDLKVDNSDGIPDHTEIRLSRMHADIAGDVIDARLSLATPVSDPDMDLFLKGMVDLSNVSKFYPLEKGTVLKGTVIADASIKGRLSAMKAQQTDRFSASGSVKATQIEYSGPSVLKPVLLRTMDLMLDTKRFELAALDLKTGNTDIKAHGFLQNVIGYMLKDEVVQGTLTVSSPSLDLNEWMSEASTGTADVDTTPMMVFEVPSNIDFILNADVAHLKYQDLQISNVKGSIEMREKTVAMKGVNMEMLDGRMSMSGSYSTANSSAPAIDFDFDVKDFDIRETVEKFSTIEKMAPLSKHCEGRFGVSMKLKGTLDKHMKPVLESLNGNGKLATSKVTVSGFEAFNKVAEVLMNPAWKKFDIPSMNPSFKFVNGRVYVDPFEVSINGWKTTIAGSNGFDQTMDYVLNVEMPRSTLGGAANTAIDNLVALANSKGADFKTGDVIPVRITMKGTVKDPKISTDLNSQGAKALDQLKDAAAAEFEKQKAALEAKAREEADKLKTEAEARLNAEKEKAQKEADRLRKEAETKAKATA